MKAKKAVARIEQSSPKPSNPYAQGNTAIF
jgi:hypothetical protein